MSAVEIDTAVAERGDWAWFPPGPELMLRSPDGAGLADLSDEELLEATASARRQTSWAQARELAAIAELHRRRRSAEEGGDPDYRILSAYESVVEEVALALTVTSRAAAILVHLADRLATDLPRTRTALEAGSIDLARARVICDGSDGLPPGVAEQVEAAVVGAAPSQTTGQLRQRVKRVVRRLAPDQVEDRKERAVRQRRLELWESPTGTCDLALLDLAPEDAHAVFNKITAIARSLIGDGDGRSLNAIRADLAKELLNGARLPDAARTVLEALQNQDPTSAYPSDARASAQPSTPAAEESGHPDPEESSPSGQTTTGACARPGGDSEGAGRFGGFAGSGEAAGGVGGRDETVIAVVAGIVEQRLTAVRDHARATGRLGALPWLSARAVQDLQGALGGLRDSWCEGADATSDTHGRPGYRPPARLRRAVQERHATCVFPTCNIRSSRCDLDHTVPYGEGGTCACNLAPLCRRHHRTKQTTGWRLFQLWPGLLVWVTPSGSWSIARPDRE